MYELSSCKSTWIVVTEKVPDVVYEALYQNFSLPPCRPKRTASASQDIRNAADAPRCSLSLYPYHVIQPTTSASALLHQANSRFIGTVTADWTLLVVQKANHQTFCHIGFSNFCHWHTQH